MNCFFVPQPPHNVPFKYLFPLLQETVKKAKIIGPVQAQTGPARRQDDITVQTHIENLQDYPLFQEIYSAISDSIALTYYHEDH